jgi:hypothetical protein
MRCKQAAISSPLPSVYPAFNLRFWGYILLITGCFKSHGKMYPKHGKIACFRIAFFLIFPFERKWIRFFAIDQLFFNNAASSDRKCKKETSGEEAT